MQPGEEVMFVPGFRQFFLVVLLATRGQLARFVVARAESHRAGARMVSPTKGFGRTVQRFMVFAIPLAVHLLALHFLVRSDTRWAGARMVMPPPAGGHVRDRAER
jgi:hypothetical protein